MQKYKNSEIKSFQFSDIKGAHVIEQNPFTSFEFKPLSGDAINAQNASQAEIRSERTYALKNNFKMDETVSVHRGLSKQEQNDIEERIQAEVIRRCEIAYVEAKKDGFEKGRAEGLASSSGELKKEIDKKIEDFSLLISEVQAQTEKLSTSSKTEMYEFIKRFTKWIVLKEIDDKSYLKNLFEKLILELNARKNLIIKVGKNNFSQMPEVIEAFETKLGQLSNIRLEIVPEISHPGIIIESENGLIDGSIEGVFLNIDKIFEQVVKHE